MSYNNKSDDRSIPASKADDSRKSIFRASLPPPRGTGELQYVITSPSSTDSGDEEKGVQQPVEKSTKPSVTKQTKPPEIPPSCATLIYSAGALSVGAILGESLRVFVGYLMGKGCLMQTHWLFDIVNTLNLCLTSTSSDPTAVFSDLPANMLGCFIMGLLQPCSDLNLLTDSSIPWLPYRHPFQSATLLHLCLRTGFCGSLTTLSSWNTQMVIQMYNPSTNTTHLFTSILGYVIGLETSLASLKLGQLCSIWIHRRVYPHMAKAEDIVSYAAQSQKNLVFNSKIPDFERRYLDNLLSEEEKEWAVSRAAQLRYLQQWRTSTQSHRVSKEVNPLYRVAIEEIEYLILVQRLDLDPSLHNIAHDQRWDVHALVVYAENAVSAIDFETLAHPSDKLAPDSFSIFSPLVGSILTLMAICLPCVFAYYGFGSDRALFYRGVFLSAVMAPFGAILRWRLSKFNGQLKSHQWFPLGTFIANILACAVSIVSASLIFKLQNKDTIVWILSAIQTGFAGSLSTVSTYVVEGDKLDKSYRHHAKSFFYLAGTLVVGCLMSLVLYLPITLL